MGGRAGPIATCQTLGGPGVQFGINKFHCGSTTRPLCGTFRAPWTSDVAEPSTDAALVSTIRFREGIESRKSYFITSSGFAGMTMPTEQLRELLEAYLDDALTTDELSALQKRLDTDRQASHLLNRLREERIQRLVAMRSDPRFQDAKLPDDFLPRVLQAMESQRSGENAASPQMTVAKTLRLPPKRRLPRSVWWTLAATAAAMLVAIAVWPGRSGPTTALQPLQPESDADHRSAEPAEDQMPVAAERERGEDATEQSPMSQTPAGGPAVPRENLADTGMAALDSALAELAPAEAEPQSLDAIAEVSAMPGIPMSIVLVYEVTQTAKGRETAAVVAALQAAGIEMQKQRFLTPEVVGLFAEADVAQTSGDSQADAAVLFVQASARMLDRFMLNVFRDDQHFQTIRWNMATDASLLEAVAKLHASARGSPVRPGTQSSAWPLAAADQTALQPTVDADQSMPLLPLERESWIPAASAASGAEEISNVLLLIR